MARENRGQRAVKTSFPKTKMKAVMLENIHPAGLNLLREEGYQVETAAGSPDKAKLLRMVRDAHLLGVRSKTDVTAEVLDAAPRLLAVGCFCIGTNQVDLPHARRAGLPVFNSPFSNTRSVAELTIAEIIALYRRLVDQSARMHRGEWDKSAAGAHEVRGRTLGIVGYGHIGAQVSVMAEAVGMRVVFHDVVPKLALGNARQVKDLGTLLKEADVVTLHVPATAATKNMIAAPQLAKMKRGSHLINASRGNVVDIDALAGALEAGHLAGAAIDVFPVEPKGNDGVFESPLVRFDNVILTPHIGGSTMEAQANIGLEVAEKLVRYSDNGTSTSSVNFPEVALPAHPGKHRLLHIHRNVPGVLSQINSILSDNQINIAGQYLQTNEAVGYVVIDLDARSSDLALEKLAQVPGTIRSRVLF